MNFQDGLLPINPFRHSSFQLVMWNADRITAGNRITLPPPPALPGTRIFFSGRTEPSAYSSTPLPRTGQPHPGRANADQYEALPDYQLPPIQLPNRFDDPNARKSSIVVKPIVERGSNLHRDEKDQPLLPVLEIPPYPAVRPPYLTNVNHYQRDHARLRAPQQELPAAEENSAPVAVRAPFPLPTANNLTRINIIPYDPALDPAIQTPMTVKEVKGLVGQLSTRDRQEVLRLAGRHKLGSTRQTANPILLTLAEEEVFRFKERHADLDWIRPGKPRRRETYRWVQIALEMFQGRRSYSSYEGAIRHLGGTPQEVRFYEGQHHAYGTKDVRLRC
ncbi:hypothetical protein BJ508DRAFT_311008 [Ascobolus immersus RN42]|uniref:Uncharacterized protein n=1 Tax=Ascobolus immersus RN42 TaxID=1160509 RepID=A0A3N4HXD2_ASCIM|nr:hypothetical protein BJ508DRAFT_311008 [Ascobolus immersus RN42]